MATEASDLALGGACCLTSDAKRSSRGSGSLCSHSSDHIIATQLDPFRVLTLHCNSSEPSSSEQERTGKAAQRGPDGSECSNSGRSDDLMGSITEPILKEHADRFTMHPIR